MKEEIKKIDTCINRLNTVKSVLIAEGEDIKKSEIIFISVLYYVNTLVKYIMRYSQPFIKNTL